LNAGVKTWSFNSRMYLTKKSFMKKTLFAELSEYKSKFFYVNVFMFEGDAKWILKFFALDGLKKLFNNLKI
jgi:hypothetical protein